MSDFIVMGLIPGTQTELTFTFWLYGVCLLGALIILRKLWRSSTFRAALITLRLIVVLRRPLSL